MMERGAIGELIPREGESGEYEWFSWDDESVSENWEITSVFRGNELLARFYGPDAIRLERVALFLTTEQS